MVPLAVGLKTPELPPPLLRLMTPTALLMTPPLLKASRKLLVPVAVVLVSVPKLLKVEPTPPLLLQEISFCAVNVPLLLKIELLVTKTLPLPVQVTLPWLLTVRALMPLPALPLMLNAAVGEAVVVPAPAKVPPDQLRVLPTVSVPMPSCV